MRKKTERILETDLDQPLRDFLVAQGYSVQAEVAYCDLVATKETELVIVEMKSSLNATLLIQAVKRQKLTASVYIAIPRPKRGRTSRHWNDVCYLLRRLELGLLLVDLQTAPPEVEVVFHPGTFDRSKSSPRRQQQKVARLLNEVRERHGSYNIGGSSRRKLMTAYKQKAFHIACYLERYGPLSPSELRGLGSDNQKTAAILQKNYYGWFERVGRGVYQITPAGKEFIGRYPELAAFYRQKAPEQV
jgi:hypothetical protein